VTTKEENSLAVWLSWHRWGVGVRIQWWKQESVGINTPSCLDDDSNGYSKDAKRGNQTIQTLAIVLTFNELSFIWYFPRLHFFVASVKFQVPSRSTYITYTLVYVVLVPSINRTRHPINLRWKSSSWINRPGRPFPRGPIGQPVLLMRHPHCRSLSHGTVKSILPVLQTHKYR